MNFKHIDKLIDYVEDVGDYLDEEIDFTIRLNTHYSELHFVLSTVIDGELIERKLMVGYYDDEMGYDYVGLSRQVNNFIERFKDIIESHY